MQKPFYITTPIYYVNDRPHIGHSYTTIAADLITRFHRLAGRESFFLTGTDEHGNKVAEAAEQAGLPPQEFCDRVVEHFKAAWEGLDIEYDDFIRTTDERHVKSVRTLLITLHEARTEKDEPVIYAGEYEGLYCTGCEKFLTEKELVDGLCPDHRIPPQKVKEKNYFFRLSAYIGTLRDLIESEKLLILPEERRREVLGLLNQDLPDFSISREKVKWGIPLPFDASQATYVWIDALANYITAIGYGRDEATFDRWWRKAETVHIMAKDILKFHCIFWPAILLAADIPLPDKIFVHGFFTIDGQKMSKSLGNFIGPKELVDEFGADATRYLLLTQFPFGQDGDVQRERFPGKYNSDLANDLGNLVSRVAKMIEANFQGKLPPPVDNLEDADKLENKADDLTERVLSHINNFRIGAAIDDIMMLVRETNRFFDSHAPWKLVKQRQRERAGGVLYVCSELIRIIGILMYPVMPGKSLEILGVFGLEKADVTLDNARTFFSLEPGTKVKVGKPIFPRLETVKSVADGASVSEDTGEGLIDIKDFAKLELVVAEVIRAERVEGADRLLKLHINTGNDKRQIVAGIAEFYPPEKITGKKICVVTNLKPAKIRGVESEGMLLAAKKGKKLTLVVPDDDIPTGASIS